MPRAIHWGAGLAASAVLHLGAAGLYVATHDPTPPAPQSSPESQFQLDTVTAPIQDVAAQPAIGDMADSPPTDSTPVTAGSIPQSTAAPLTPTGSRAPAISAAGTAMTPGATRAQALTALDAPAPQLAAVTSSTPALETTPLQAFSAIAATPTATVLASAASTAMPALAPSAPLTATARAQPAPSIAAPATNPDAPQLASLATDAPKAAEPALPATMAKADTAWQFGTRLVTDPAALATIQAFMAPAEISNAADIKDNLSDVLARIPCARISATFLPETGTLDIQGHIPDPSMRDTVRAAMQAQVGDGIPVTANLLHLPSPQCAALTGISNVGLPQSTDQFTNERLIGQSAHARDYSYSEGQRLQFDLVAPDYDAYVYVDYFAADGTVIHLVPNDIIPLERLPAKSLIGVGTDVPGKPGLRITIAPPFGQEIAVAFASSHRLFDGVRPTVEPAEPYLAYLTEQVAVARAANPDFKGEWVYFHMTTKPATQ